MFEVKLNYVVWLKYCYLVVFNFSYNATYLKKKRDYRFKQNCYLNKV